MMQTNILFEVGQWYKFTMTGKPLKSDGEIMWNDWRNPDQVPAMCRQEYFVEGPGLLANTSEWSYSIDTFCLQFQDDFPLKVFGTTTKHQTGSWYPFKSEPLDGVLRNIVFENSNTRTSVDTTC